MKLCAFTESFTNTSIICLARFGVLPEGKGATCHSGAPLGPTPKTADVLQSFLNRVRYKETDLRTLKEEGREREATQVLTVMGPYANDLHIGSPQSSGYPLQYALFVSF